MLKYSDGDHTMNQFTSISKDVLQAELNRLQAELETLLTEAETKQTPIALEALAPPLRRMHWAASFLGAADWADLAAGGAEFVTRIRDKDDPWSSEYTDTLSGLMQCTRDFNTPRQLMPLAPEPKQPVPADKLLSFFRSRRISIERTSACRELSVEHDESFDYAVKIPLFAKQQHRNERHLSLVFLDLARQSLSLPELTALFEENRGSLDILLHGPLTLPPKESRPEGDELPYFLLLDTLGIAEEWLSANAVQGRVLNVLKAPHSPGPSKPEAARSAAEPAEPSADQRASSPAEPEAARSAAEPAEPSPGRSAAAPAAAGIPDSAVNTPPAAPKTGRQTRGRRKTSRSDDSRVRFSVGFKLILIVSTIIIVSMSSLSIVGLIFFRREIRNRVEETNITLSRMVARQAENEILHLTDSANLLFQLGSAEGGSQALVDDFFFNSQSLIYVGILGTDYGFTNRNWFRANRIFDENAVVRSILGARSPDLERARDNQTVIINVSPLIPNLETPLTALSIPFLLGTSQEALVILADVGSSLAESVRLQEGYTTTMIINSEGEVLAHPDFSRVFGGESLRDSPVFAKMYAQGTPTGRILFTDESGDKPASAIGSFALIPLGNLGVVSTVLENDAFRVVNRVQILNLTLLGTILSLAVLGVFLFSQSLSSPLKKLTLATRQIKARNYNIAIQPRTSDELGQLTRNFISMIPELEKVDRLQERTSKFVNPQVARMIAEDSLPDHAETKDVTVFFSDVRGFTAMSESMADPQLVLNNLSEYFQAMVPCVEQTLGTVDKFIGDAIMAVWGSMSDLENNAEAAVNGALMMRSALMDFNADRGTLKSPIFRIGCGLNSGPITVGMMGGGTAKEEWAHMGDTVNLASRIEALNKTMGTDILISESTANRVKSLFDLVPMNAMRVKGKSKPQRIYAVLGRMDDDERPRSLEEVRRMLGISGDFSGPAGSGSHEAKFDIIDP